MEKELESEVKGPMTRAKSGALNTPDRVLRPRGDKSGMPGKTPPKDVSPKHTPRTRSSIESGTFTPKRGVRASSAQPEGHASTSTKKITSRRRSSSLQPESPKKEESNPSIARRKRISVTPDLNLARTLRSVAKSDSSIDASKSAKLPAILKTNETMQRSSCSPSKETLTKSLIPNRRKSLLPSSESSSKPSDSFSLQTFPNLSRKKLVKGIELSSIDEAENEHTITSSGASSAKAKLSVSPKMSDNGALKTSVTESPKTSDTEVPKISDHSSADHKHMDVSITEVIAQRSEKVESEVTSKLIEVDQLKDNCPFNVSTNDMLHTKMINPTVCLTRLPTGEQYSFDLKQENQTSQDENKSIAEGTNPDVITNAKESQISDSIPSALSSSYTLAASNKALMFKGLVSADLSKKPLSPVTLNECAHSSSGKENKKPLLLNVVDKAEPIYAEASSTISTNHAEVIKNVQKSELRKLSNHSQEISERVIEAQAQASENYDKDDLEFKLRLSENESHASNECCIVSSNQSPGSNVGTVSDSDEGTVFKSVIEETNIHEQANKTSHFAVEKSDDISVEDKCKEKEISIEVDSSEEIRSIGKSINEGNLSVAELNETVDHANNIIEEEGDVSLTINVKDQDDVTAVSSDDSKKQSNDDSELNFSRTNPLQLSSKHLHNINTTETVTTEDGIAHNETPTEFNEDTNFLCDIEKYSSPKKGSFPEKGNIIIDDVKKFTGSDKNSEAEILKETVQSSEIKTSIPDDIAQSIESSINISDELASNVDNDPQDKSAMSSDNEIRVNDDEAKVCDSEIITSDEIIYETSKKPIACSNEGTDTPNKEATSVNKTMVGIIISSKDDSYKEDGNVATTDDETSMAAKSLNDITSSGIVTEAKIMDQEESKLLNESMEKLHEDENEVSCAEVNFASGKETSGNELNTIIDKEDCSNLLLSECANQIEGDLSSRMDEKNRIEELDESITVSSLSISVENKLESSPVDKVDKKVSVTASDTEVFIIDEKINDKHLSPFKSHESCKCNNSINKCSDEMNDSSDISQVESISSSDEETDALLNNQSFIDKSNDEKKDDITVILDDNQLDESTSGNTEKSVFINPLQEKNMGHTETTEIILDKINMTTKNMKVSLGESSKHPLSPKMNHFFSEESSAESTHEELILKKYFNKQSSVLQEECSGSSESQSSDSEKSLSGSVEAITGRDFLDIEAEEGEETSSDGGTTSSDIDVQERHILGNPSYFEPNNFPRNLLNDKVVCNLCEHKDNLKKARSEKINDCVEMAVTNPLGKNLNKPSSSSESIINNKLGAITTIKRKENVHGQIEMKKNSNENPTVCCGVPFEVKLSKKNLKHDEEKRELPRSRNFKVSRFTTKSYQYFISRCSAKNDKSIINCNGNKFFVALSDNGLPKQPIKGIISHDSVSCESRSKKKDLKHQIGDSDEKTSCVGSTIVSPLRLDFPGSTSSEPSSKRKHKDINDKNNELKSNQGFQSSSSSSTASKRSKKRLKKAASSQENIISSCSDVSDPSVSREGLRYTNEGKKSKPIAVIHYLGKGDNAHLLHNILCNNGIKKIEHIEFSWEPQKFKNFQGRGTIEFSNENELQKAVNMSSKLKMNGRQLWMKPSKLYKPSSEDFELWLSSYNRLYMKRQIRKEKAN